MVYILLLGNKHNIPTDLSYISFHYSKITKLNLPTARGFVTCLTLSFSFKTCRVPCPAFVLLKLFNPFVDGCPEREADEAGCKDRNNCAGQRRQRIPLAQPLVKTTHHRLRSRSAITVKSSPCGTVRAVKVDRGFYLSVAPSRSQGLSGWVSGLGFVLLDLFWDFHNQNYLRVSTVVRKQHNQKQGRKERVHLNFLFVVNLPGNSAYLETGTKTETMKECCLLTCSSWLEQPDFFCSPKPPAERWHHPQCTGPSHINH